MRYRFELNRSKKNRNGLIPIRVVIIHKKIRIRRNVANAKCLECDWDNGSYYIKNLRGNPNFDSYTKANSEIQDIKDRLEKLEKYLELNELDLTKEIFENKFENKESSYKTPFWEALKEFIEKSYLTKAEKTVKRYEYLQTMLSNFENFSNYPMDFEMINLQFEESFMKYCFEEKKYHNNYYGRTIGGIKTFMRWSFNKGYHQNLEYQKFKRPENEIEVIHLEKDELFELFHYQFKEDRLNRAKDMFCFACFTGLRYSDLSRIEKENIHGDIIHFTIQKTKSVDHRFKLNRFALEIIEKYKDSLYEPFPKISAQKLNKYIQECCQIIGMDSQITLTRYQGSKAIRKTYKKYELITSHVARKTFVTLSLYFGMSERVVRNITNHKDERSFRRYVRISDAMKNQEMERTWNSL